MIEMVWLSLQRLGIVIMSCCIVTRYFGNSGQNRFGSEKEIRTLVTFMPRLQHGKGKTPWGIFAMIKENGAPILMRWMH